MEKFENLMSKAISERIESLENSMGTKTTVTILEIYFWKLSKNSEKFSL